MDEGEFSPFVLWWSRCLTPHLQDKEAVEQYKAEIKTQLIRAGLLRGQPRSVMLQSGAPVPAPTRRTSPKRPLPKHRHSMPPPLPDVTGLGLDTNPGLAFVDGYAVTHASSAIGKRHGQSYRYSDSTDTPFQVHLKQDIRLINIPPPPPTVTPILGASTSAQPSLSTTIPPRLIHPHRYPSTSKCSTLVAIQAWTSSTTLKCLL